MNFRFKYSGLFFRILFCFIFVCNIKAQESDQVMFVVDSVAKGDFYALSLRLESEELDSLKLYTEKDGVLTSHFIHRDFHYTGEGSTFGPLFLDKKTDKIYISRPIAVEIELFSLYDPGISVVHTQSTLNFRSDCICESPEVIPRDAWCSSGLCPPDPEPVYHEPEHLIIHHSAGTNISSDWGGVVRSIWNHHVNVNGWDDIGYNYLIDPQGNIYEGRGLLARGAHFCSKNTGTLGICVLGNYQIAEPSEEAIESLEMILMSFSCNLEIPVFGEKPHGPEMEELSRIAGHRDGCSTLCPGKHLYEKMPQIRFHTYLKRYMECLSEELVLAGDSEGALVILSWTYSGSADSFYIETTDSFTFTPELILSTVAYNATIPAPMGKTQFRVRAVKNGEIKALSNNWLYSPQDDQVSDRVYFYYSPIDDIITVNLSDEWPDPGILQIQLYNVAGKIIRNMEITYHGRQVTISDFGQVPAGIYFLQIKNSQNSYLEKILLL